MKKVSVIIPCYNATKWLPKCFLSLVEQTIGIEELELIFVDDASTDDGKTWELLQQFEQAYPESILILQLEENMRQGGARNVALQYASGEYVAFVDADDFVTNDYLEKVYSKAKSEDADLVQFEYFYYTERTGAFETGKSKEESCENKGEVITIHNAEQRKIFLISEKLTYGCWNKLYKTELVKAAGVRFAEHVIYEEPLFVYPLLFWAKKIVTMPDRFYYYRQNESGTMWNDMKKMDTIYQHANVQLAVWNFMKQTKFFEQYYEEIKLYFLHSYLYETLLFAKQRGFTVGVEDFRKLASIAIQEVEDYQSSKYSLMIPKQMQLYQLMGTQLSEQQLCDFQNSI